MQPQRLINSITGSHHALDSVRLSNEVYLANREYELAESYFVFIKSRISNKQFLIRLKQPITAELFTLTPQEELFAEFFKNEKIEVKDKTDEELREHIDTLQKIAFEARARLYAAKDEDSERKSKRKRGISASVPNDELSSNAINAVTARSVKLSKREKMIQGLIDKVGIDRATAEAMVPDTEKMSKGRTEASKDKLKKVVDRASIPVPTIDFNPKPVVNPFAAKVEPIIETETVTEVTIMDDAVVIKETTTEVKPEEVKAPAAFNPFAK